MKNRLRKKVIARRSTYLLLAWIKYSCNTKIREKVNLAYFKFHTKLMEEISSINWDKYNRF